MASTSMCSSQTSVPYCLVEHPAPLRRSCYTYGHGRGRIWYRCRRLRLSPPHWKCNVMSMTHPPARRKIDSWAPVEAKARVKAGVRVCLCLASQIEHLVPGDAICGHVWCIWSRCVHVRTGQRAGLSSEARLRVGRPWVKLWALRWLHGQPEAELSYSVPVKVISRVIHETSDLDNAGIYSCNKKKENHVNLPCCASH